MVQWGRLLVSDVKVLGNLRISGEDAYRRIQVQHREGHFETEVKPQEDCTGFTMMTLATTS